MLHLEFTIEPFVEGRPGPHVTGAIAAAEALGVDVEVGPFGSSCLVTPEGLPDVLGAIGREAFAHGATHLNLHVSDQASDHASGPDGGSEHEPETASENASETTSESSSDDEVRP